MFLSEFTLPTDHLNFEFRLLRLLERPQARVDQAGSCESLAAGIGLTHSATSASSTTRLGTDGLEVNRGLIDRSGRKKPAYRAYKRG